MCRSLKHELHETKAQPGRDLLNDSTFLGFEEASASATWCFLKCRYPASPGIRGEGLEILGVPLGFDSYYIKKHVSSRSHSGWCEQPA